MKRIIKKMLEKRREKPITTLGKLKRKTYFGMVGVFINGQLKKL